jgi:hypothetical protein
MLLLPPLLGLFMISKIKYIHFFNRFVRGRKTFNFLVQGILCIFLIAFYHEWAFLLCFLAYLLSGPCMTVYQFIADGVKKRRKKATFTSKDKK